MQPDRSVTISFSAWHADRRPSKETSWLIFPRVPTSTSSATKQRDLLRAAKNGDAAALARIRASSDRITLASAQLAIARQYGPRSASPPMVAERDEIPVVSYARISADIERDEHGVQAQHSTNRATAERYGWTMVHEFTDNDKSAAKSNVVRDDFEAMLRALRSGKLPDGRAVQGVVVVADDRLARRPGDYERFVEAITYRDGRVFSDQRGRKDLYSEDVESIGLIGAVISKAEVRKMQRRMRNDHRRRALAGEPQAGG
jgi:DNA invertase Pin-like site-specific DNA recombinase